MSLLKGMILSCLVFSLALSAMAQSRNEIKREIRDLSYRIERDVDMSEASNNRLRQARELLQDALELVRNGGSDPDLFQECVDYAYKIYYRTTSSANALDKAGRSCRQVVDMDILKFLYDKYYRTQSSSNALDLAASQAVRGTRSKLSLLKFAYDKHYQTNSSSNAATKSVENIKIIDLRRNGSALSCVKKHYDIYYRSMNSSRAMDRAAQACRGFNMDVQ